MLFFSFILQFEHCISTIYNKRVIYFLPPEYHSSYKCLTLLVEENCWCLPYEAHGDIPTVILMVVRVNVPHC